MLTRRLLGSNSQGLRQGLLGPHLSWGPHHLEGLGKDWVPVPVCQLSPHPGHKPTSRQGLNTLGLQQNTRGPSTRLGNNHQDPPAQRARSHGSCPDVAAESPRSLHALSSGESSAKPGINWTHAERANDGQWGQTEQPCPHPPPLSRSPRGCTQTQGTRRGWGRPGSRCPQQLRPPALLRRPDLNPHSRDAAAPPPASPLTVRPQTAPCPTPASVSASVQWVLGQMIPKSFVYLGTSPCVGSTISLLPQPPRPARG